MAHLISLGGWLRGLEISAGAVAAKYSPERAAVLGQPDLLDYFEEELQTLPPQVAHDAVFEKLRPGVKSIQQLLRQGKGRTLQLNDVKAIADHARELNLVIERGE
jgi:hypothetical protein